MLETGIVDDELFSRILGSGHGSSDLPQQEIYGVIAE